MSEIFLLIFVYLVKFIFCQLLSSLDQRFHFCYLHPLEFFADNRDIGLQTKYSINRFLKNKDDLNNL